MLFLLNHTKQVHQQKLINDNLGLKCVSHFQPDVILAVGCLFCLCLVAEKSVYVNYFVVRDCSLSKITDQDLTFLVVSCDSSTSAVIMLLRGFGRCEKLGHVFLRGLSKSTSGNKLRFIYISPLSLCFLMRFYVTESTDGISADKLRMPRFARN